MDTDVNIVILLHFISPLPNCSDRIFVSSLGDCAASTFQVFLHITEHNTEVLIVIVENVEYSPYKFMKKLIGLVSKLLNVSRLVAT